ncbi:MAG: hypothetical protein LBG17_02830 [Bacteroidales bacterium]|jgi:predicted DNA-binding transcriptional regulator AlpA|nr:hypothetical protein [Bacteroidales bacterium]
MKYDVNRIIKGLQKSGKKFVSKDELTDIMLAATPKINDIDRQIKLIEKGIKEVERGCCGKVISDVSYYNSNYDYITFSMAEKLTGISRPTLYSWAKCGIISTGLRGESAVFSLSDLLQTLQFIKTKKSKH